jgi:hypothetical protein
MEANKVSHAVRDMKKKSKKEGSENKSQDISKSGKAGMFIAHQFTMMVTLPRFPMPAADAKLK